ncbi:MAG: DUF4118 domain-containing protein [Deltaproteobacteria bacterium]|nr:DUF4118 domain-containing protein [Deltaproteobacteria bacterium]
MTPPPGAPRGAAGYGWAALLVAATTGVAWVARYRFSVPDVEMLFLLAVSVAAAFLGKRPSLLAAALGVGCYDFFFVPPPFTFDIGDARYLLTFAMLFAAGVVVSSLTSGLRQERQAALRREERALAQYGLASALASASSAAAVCQAAARFAASAFGGSAAVLLRGEAGTLELAAAEGGAPSPELTSWARSALASGRPAGAADGLLCLPLLAGLEPVGVLGVAPWAEDGSDAERTPLVEALAQQVASALLRVRLGEEARQAERRASAEEQRSALLSSVSHDLRTPLAAITGAATALRGDPALPPAQRAELLETVCEEAERMERLVANLLDMTRLQGGAAPRREWVPLEEVLGAALARVERLLGDRPVKVEGAAALVHADPVLLGQLFLNLLENAAKYTPPGTPLTIRCRQADEATEVEVADRGPGFGQAEPERLFERFSRGSHPGVGGAGLGLAIARAIAEVHGGTLTAQRGDPGAVFRLTLPGAGAPPEVPPEREAV